MKINCLHSGGRGEWRWKERPNWKSEKKGMALQERGRGQRRRKQLTDKKVEEEKGDERKGLTGRRQKKSGKKKSLD